MNWLPPGFMGMSIAALGGAAPTWTPLSLSQPLIAWYEADDLTTLYTDAGVTNVSADGQTVAEWHDKSGNGNKLTNGGTSTRSPTYRTGSGHPYLDFNGTANYFSSSAAVVPGDGTGQHWVAVAIYFNAQSTLQYVDKIVGTGSVSSIRNSSGTNTSGSYNTTGTLTDDTGNSIASATPFVFIQQITSTSNELFVDNASNGSTALSGTRQNNSASFHLGSNAGASFMGGRIYAVVRGTGVLSSTDRTNLQAYMAALHP